MIRTSLTRLTTAVFIAVAIVCIGQANGQSISDQIAKNLKLIELGNSKLALSNLNNLLSANPKNADVMAAHSIAAMENGAALPGVESELSAAYDIEHRSVLVRVARGMLFGKENKREDAVSEFRHALKLDDKNLSTYLYLARFYLSVDSLKAAEVTLYQAQGVNGNDVRPYIGLAELFERERTLPLAVEQYEQAKKLDPNDIAVRAKLAGLYYRTRRYDESVNEWVKITKIDSSYSRAFLEIALIYFKSEQYSNSAVYAEKYNSLVPDDIEGIWLAAKALSESNQYQKALPYLEKASKNDSLKAFTQLYLARGFFFSKEFSKADSIFSSSKTLGPSDLYYWGYSKISLGDTTGGLDKWRQSLVGDTVRKKDDQVKVYQQIISFLSAQHRWNDAAKTYLDLNTIQNSVDNIIKAGQLYNFGGQLADAKNAFSTVLAKDPKNISALIGIADVEMKDETTVADAEKSVTTAAGYATTVDQKESVGEAYARLGIQFYKNKNFEKSAEMLDAAQKNLSPKSAYQINVDKAMATTYLQLKKYEKAEEFYKKALAIDPKDEDAKKGVEFLKQIKGKKQ